MSKNVRIVMHAHGRGEVFVNGHKVGGVKAVKFGTAVNKTNEVVLTLNSESVEIDGAADISTIGSEVREWVVSSSVLADKARRASDELRQAESDYQQAQTMEAAAGRKVVYAREKLREANAALMGEIYGPDREQTSVQRDGPGQAHCVKM